MYQGPLELLTVLETIEMNNYNRKYGDKKPKAKNREEFTLTAHPTENKLLSQSQNGKENRLTPTRINDQTETFAANQIGHRNIHSWHESTIQYLQEDGSFWQSVQI